MEFLTIDRGMVENSLRGVTQLCNFFNFTAEEKEGNLFYFVEGEGFNSHGFTLSESSETEKVLREGDILVRVGKDYEVLPKTLHFMVNECHAADRMEEALIKIYESGEISSRGESIARNGLGFGEEEK